MHCFSMKEYLCTHMCEYKGYPRIIEDVSASQLPNGRLVLNFPSKKFLFLYNNQCPYCQKTIKTDINLITADRSMD
jgi:hypothetical protein